MLIWIDVFLGAWAIAFCLGIGIKIHLDDRKYAKKFREKTGKNP